MAVIQVNTGFRDLPAGTVPVISLDARVSPAVMRAEKKLLRAAKRILRNSNGNAPRDTAPRESAAQE